MLKNKRLLRIERVKNVDVDWPRTRYWVGTIDFKFGVRKPFIRRRVLYCFVGFVPRYFYLVGADKGFELPSGKWLKKRVEVDIKWVEKRFGKDFVRLNNLRKKK